MARLAPSLEAAIGVPVLASPRSGVEDLRDRLEILAAKPIEIAAAT
jgi:hypothetical protein